MNNPLKKLGSSIFKKLTKTDAAQQDLFKNLGDLTPFTVFTEPQVESFLRTIMEDSAITETEKDAFLLMMSSVGAKCFYYHNDGLKEGIHTVRNNEDVGIKAGKVSIEGSAITLQYGKRNTKGFDSDKTEAERGRVDTVLRTPDGNVVILQHEKNRYILPVYVSNLSERFAGILERAEAKALNLITHGAVNSLSVQSNNPQTHQKNLPTTKDL